MKNVISEVFCEKIALPVLRLLQKLTQDFGVPRLHPLWKIVKTQNFLLQSLTPNKSLSKSICYALNEASEVFSLNFLSFSFFHGYPTLKFWNK